MNYPLPKDGSIDYMLSIAKARAKRCVEKKIVIEQDEDDYPLYQVVTKEIAKTELGEIFGEISGICADIPAKTRVSTTRGKEEISSC